MRLVGSGWRGMIIRGDSGGAGLLLILGWIML